MKTKLLSLLMAVVMVFSAFQLTVFAYTSGYYTYSLSDGEVTITDVDRAITGEGYDIVIPSSINGYPVVNIGDASFENNFLQSVVIPESIKIIGNNAFYHSNLKNVTIPNTVTSLGERAFQDCSSLTHAVIGDGITIVNNYTFNNCTKLVSVKFGNNVETIGKAVFSTCGFLEEIIIPDSLTLIDEYSFYHTYGLAHIYYEGTEEEWKSITIAEHNDTINNATIHYNSCLYNVDYLHKYASSITTPATHLADGVKTFTCGCGDSYTEVIEKTSEHTHETVVTAPTCTENGYTTYTCECGDSYVADYVNANGHDYDAQVTTPATHLTEGVMTYTCECGDIYTESIDKTTVHSYNAVETAPTCTEQGYTTYTCECGDSYVADYVNANGHDYDAQVTTPATHLTEGVMTYTCGCGDSYTETIDKTTVHSYNAVETAPTCTEQGYTTYTCECGDSYVADYVDANGHKDMNNDKKCDSCEFVFETNEDDESDNDNGTDNDNETGKDDEYKCFCACHSENSFVAFIYKIVRILRSLLGLNFCRNCKCVYV